MKFNKSIVYQLHAVTYSMDKVAGEILAEQKKLSYSQFLIMIGVYYNQGATQKFLQDHTLLTNAAVSKSLTILEKRKLISRKESKTNRRENSINLTASGKSCVEEMSQVLDAKFQSYLAGLKEKEVSNMSSSLGKILINLNNC